MEIRHSDSFIRQTKSFRNAIIYGGLAVAACLVGSGVIAAGSASTSQMLAAGITLGLLLSGVAALALDIPVIGFIRAAFIASFFGKIDATFFKIDEMEDPSGLNISATLIIGLVLLAYDFMKDGERERVFPPAFSFLLIALFVFAAASVLHAGPVSLGVFSLISLCTSVLIAYATASHFGRRGRISFLIIGLGAGVAFTGLIAFTQYTIEWPLDLEHFGTGTEEEHLGTQTQSLGRVPALLRTPTEMAWVLSALIPLIIAPVIFRLKSYTFVQRTLLATAGLAGVVGMILSLARGSWIGLMVAVFLLVVFGWLRISEGEKKSYLTASVGVLFLMCIFMAPFAGKIYDRLTEDDRGAAAIRLPLMENAVRMIADNSILGVGLNGYRTTMTKYDETGVFVSQVFPNPVHNIFAHTAAEVGIPGGILFCMLIIYGIVEGFRNGRSRDQAIAAIAVGAAIGLIAFVISGLKEPGSLGSVRPPFRTCFLLLGTVMAIS
jgi:hypothetical protein